MTFCDVLFEKKIFFESICEYYINQTGTCTYVPNIKDPINILRPEIKIKKKIIDIKFYTICECGAADYFHKKIEILDLEDIF